MLARKTGPGDIHQHVQEYYYILVDRLVVGEVVRAV